MSALSSLSSVIFCWYSALTVYSSSLTECSSSFVLCSSSFDATSSSFVACISSFEVSSSSIVACSVSRVYASSVSSVSMRSRDDLIDRDVARLSAGPSYRRLGRRHVVERHEHVARAGPRMDERLGA